ncbi:MAG: hypothetical protein JXB10_12650 [Pirellulales bacterium]|nr:hypothetical protein [Pirellulales bacterium]
MPPLHPNILQSDGKNQFVILPYEEFVQLEEELQQYEDLKALRKAKSEEAASFTVPLSGVKKELDNAP